MFARVRAPQPAVSGGSRDAGAGTSFLPERLKASLERSWGRDLSHVRVHWNSPQPARLGAHAYTQGSDIHLGPGQEEHLPHEAWHTVQQREGRVGATARVQNLGVNDDAVLENEAEAMGARAPSLGSQIPPVLHPPSPQAFPRPTGSVIQGYFTIRAKYDDARRAEIAYGKSKIQLPPHADEAYILQTIKAWAADPTDRGTYGTWQKLVDSIVSTAPSTSTTSPVVTALTSSLPGPSSPTQNRSGQSDPFVEYSPSKAVSSSPLSNVRVKAFNRRVSDSFFRKSGFERKIRTSTVEMVHKASSLKGVTVGRGRFLHMSGKKVLGKTLYTEFLPRLPKLLNLDNARVAQAIVDGLLDDQAFQKTLGGLGGEDAKTALLQTVMLLQNEILHRSTINLLPIYGAARRTVADSSKTVSERLMATSLFIPSRRDDPKGKIGGQKLSRAHHPENEKLVDHLQGRIKNVWDNFKKALQGAEEALGLDDEKFHEYMNYVIDRYIKNLKEAWAITVRPPKT